MNKHIHLIALVFCMAMLVMPTLATAQPVTVNVLSPATVIAKGAGVDVSVQVSCTNPPFSSPPAFTSNVSVQLNERVGNGVTSGSGSRGGDPITCDGSLQTFQVVVTGFSSRFAKGTAISQASAFIFDQLSFGSAQQVAKQIQLVK